MPRRIVILLLYTHSLSLLAYNVYVQLETTLDEISPKKFMHLNPELEKQQTKKLLELLK